tara:strand:+ start:175 stop:432 length:258 start_codon:yes stop_codon:yes gene_type:complete
MAILKSKNKIKELKKAVNILEKELLTALVQSYKESLYPNELEKISNLARYLGLPRNSKGYPVQSDVDKLVRMLVKHNIEIGKVVR